MPTSSIGALQGGGKLSGQRPESPIGPPCAEVQEVVAERLADPDCLRGYAPGFDSTRSLEHNDSLRLLQQQLRFLAHTLARWWLLADQGQRMGKMAACLRVF